MPLSVRNRWEGLKTGRARRPAKVHTMLSGTKANELIICFIYLLKFGGFDPGLFLYTFSIAFDLIINR